MTRKRVVIEEIRKYHIPLLAWYLWRGYDIYYLQSSEVLKEMKWLRQMHEAGRIQRLHLKKQHDIIVNPSGDLAFNAVDKLYESHFLFNPIVKRLTHLYASDDIHLAFRKSMCEGLSSLYYHSVLTAHINEVLANDSDWMLIPTHNRKAYIVPWWVALSWQNLIPVKERAGNRIPFCFKVVGWFSLLAKTFRSVLVCTHFLALAGWAALWSRQKPAPLTYDFAVTIIAPQREFANQIRGFDFLLDKERIRKDNTLFVPLAKLAQQERDRLRDCGAVIADTNVPPDRSVFWRVLGHGLLLLIYGLKAPEWMFRTAVYLLKDYWQWSGFVQRYKVGKFVTYCDFGFRHISRNILLRRQGTTTWYYVDTVNTGGTFAIKPDGSAYVDPGWGYLMYDYFVSWNERFNRYHQMHRQQIGQYITVGCLWSEHVRLLKEGRIRSGLLRKISEVGYSANLKLIAVFDSTYSNYSPTSYADGAAFARGIEQLIEGCPDLFVMWKEKKPRWLHRDRKYAALVGDSGGLEQIYDRLATHPRCYFTGHDTSTSEVLSVCDLAISFPFTSTTAEALGAQVKAIYYDPNKKYLGSYYDRFPGLVAHGYRQLRERVEELLYNTTCHDYNEYLETYIKGEIDPFLDGMALTRFRNLLCDGPTKSQGNIEPALSDSRNHPPVELVRSVP